MFLMLQKWLGFAWGVGKEGDNSNVVILGQPFFDQTSLFFCE